jgi:hypothetical protein
MGSVAHLGRHHRVPQQRAVEVPDPSALQLGLKMAVKHGHRPVVESPHGPRHAGSRQAVGVWFVDEKHAVVGIGRLLHVLPDDQHPAGSGRCDRVDQPPHQIRLELRSNEDVAIEHALGALDRVGESVAEVARGTLGQAAEQRAVDRLVGLDHADLGARVVHEVPPDLVVVVAQARDQEQARVLDPPRGEHHESGSDGHPRAGRGPAHDADDRSAAGLEPEHVRPEQDVDVLSLLERGPPEHTPVAIELRLGVKHRRDYRLAAQQRRAIRRVPGILADPDRQRRTLVERNQRLVRDRPPRMGDPVPMVEVDWIESLPPPGPHLRRAPETADSRVVRDLELGIADLVERVVLQRWPALAALEDTHPERRPRELARQGEACRAGADHTEVRLDVRASQVRR